MRQALDDNLEKATELPYFDGDFWPNTLEDSIKELDQEEEERKASAAAEAAGDMVCIQIAVQETKRTSLKNVDSFILRSERPNQVRCLRQGTWFLCTFL